MTTFTKILITVFALVVAPLLLIWALNTLFPVLAIPFNLKTWCAAFLLELAVSHNAFRQTK